MVGPEIICVGAGKTPQDVLNVNESILSWEYQFLNTEMNKIEWLRSQRIKQEATYSYQTLTVPEDLAANVLYVNGTLFHRSEKEIPASFKVRRVVDSLFRSSTVYIKILNFSTVSGIFGKIRILSPALRRFGISKTKLRHNFVLFVNQTKSSSQSFLTFLRDEINSSRV